MGFNFNYDELKDYLVAIGRTQEDFNKFLRKFIIEMAERVIAKTKLRTPVGTPESTGIPNYVGGTLRRNWQIGDIRGSGNNIEVEILNPTEYATEVEYGHRIMGGVGHTEEKGWKNGIFMLTISINEIKSKMPLRYRMEFKKFCEARGLRDN